MPGVPCDWLSLTAIVLNGSGTPPAAATPSQTCRDSSSWLRLHGIVPVHVEQTPTIGPSRRVGSMPSARKCARAGARSGAAASPARARRRSASESMADETTGARKNASNSLLLALEARNGSEARQMRRRALLACNRLLLGWTGSASAF